MKYPFMMEYTETEQKPKDNDCYLTPHPPKPSRVGGVTFLVPLVVLFLIYLFIIIILFFFFARYRYLKLFRYQQICEINAS